jgi:serine-type D-Ala-D-Ala carboxypeptidase/endopeptidase (penicillin-binding protein 4)
VTTFHPARAAALLALAALTSLGCRGGAATTARPEAASTVRQLQRALDSIADAPQFRNGHWGILVVGARGDTLYSRNAGKLFMPASNQKILTTATALAQLGPDFRYRTAIVAGGPLLGDTLIDGDLLVMGRGDPSVSARFHGDAMRPLRAVADSLHARGIRTIRGAVRPGGNAFPGATLGYGWSWEDLESGYSAAVDELLLDEGVSTVVVHGGAAPGAAPRVTTRPARTSPAVRADVQTVGRTPGDTASPTRIRVVKDTAGGGVIVTGVIAAGDSASVVVTHRDPSAMFTAALHEALVDRGIAVLGHQRPAAAMRDTRDTLAVIVSPPMSEILGGLMKPSQNQVAEMVYRTLGLERGARGTAAEGQRIVERQLLEWGAAEGGFVVRDGSGLSRYNYVSPETILRTLSAMRSHQHATAFLATMPVAGVDGTLRNRMRGTPAEANLRAKTGSVAQARSLSGYVTSAGGELLTFSFLANNWSVPAREIERAQDSLGVRLARFRR